VFYGIYEVLWTLVLVFIVAPEQKSLIASDMVLSSSSSGGVGVVCVENCGVGGGAAGSVCKLVEGEVLLMSDNDGKMYDESVDNGSVVLLDAGTGRNLPFLSHCIVLASIEDKRLACVCF
jgi:hypothetical protein